MANERITENLFTRSFGLELGESGNYEFPHGEVFVQGDIEVISKINDILKATGGKPKDLKLNDYTVTGKGKAKPEHIITLTDDPTTIIVTECKKSAKDHISDNLDKPAKYAVDGLLFYAEFLKKEYNVIGIAISGTTKANLKSSIYHWRKNASDPQELVKGRDLALDYKNIMRLVNNEDLQIDYNLSDIREVALDMHEKLRSIKITEKNKPLLIAGILIALHNKSFSNSYPYMTTHISVMNAIKGAIDTVLAEGGIDRERITYITNAFDNIASNPKLRDMPFGHTGSISWYVEQLDKKIKPMMMSSDVSLDALGVFYHEFVKYSGGDGSGLGIVLTPQHITDFMCEIAGVNKNTKVIDICCGSGSFLVAAMARMFKDANTAEEVEHIRKNNLYGIELDQDLYSLSISNMIVRQDGKSNIYNGDCFNDKIFNILKEKNIDIGLINPPYSQEDIVELEFIERILSLVKTGGTVAAIVPVSCAIGTKFGEVRERLFKNHTLEAVFTMPDELFYPTATNTCIMIWKSGVPHDSNKSTFFGYFKNDGFEKRKNLGRIDAKELWTNIRSQWIEAYNEKESIDGLTARAKVKHNDEWLCEAYMKSDYGMLEDVNFENALKFISAYELVEV